MSLTRRAFLASSTAIMALGASRAKAQSEPFSHDQVIALAREMAGQEYTPRPTVPQDWIDLTYEQYRSIWFRSKDGLWSHTDRPYEVDFFPPGLYFKRTVGIDIVEDGVARDFPFDFSRFDHSDKFPEVTLEGNLGYSGLRLRTELTEPGRKNEFCVFQGASYFRAIGYAMNYGMSARGLALKTGDPEGEEFPDFTRFWLEAPVPGQKNMIVHALLDSPSVTGAYRFDITPGPSCIMDVTATLFAREELNHIGIGALTSMFLHDATDRTRFDDFRPAVHDTDGLMVWNGAGEVLWRPLANPTRLQISSFVDQMPKGFGLMQRSRRFADFADLEALYHKRPGVWVEPKGDWGPGSVTLVEIPADLEIYDNIVAYWRPKDPVPAGESLEVAYRLTWCAEAPVDTGMARVIETRMGESHAWSEHENGRIVTIDFEPDVIFEDELDTFELRITSAQAETTEGVLQRNPDTGGLRLAFSFDPGDRDVVELRAQIRKDGAPASEVWLYRWTRNV